MPKDNLKDKLDGNELDLSLNNLEVVPVKELVAIPRATHLDLSCNLLITLPDSFCTLIHLVKVDLSKNKLTELPVDFGQLENLQHLDLLGNQLTTLPESFSLLNKLKWLDLKDNPLDTGLKKNAGDCLDEKQCRACAQRILLYMKEVSVEMEKKREKKLKAQKDREAKQKAQEEEEARKKKELKKAEKERKRQEAQARKVPKKKADHSTDEEPAEGALTGDVAKKEKTETKKDKTGRGFCSCCLAMLSIFVVLLALVVGVAFHCSTSLKDRYCWNYYNPVQARVLQAANETHRQAEEAYQTVSTSSLQYYKVASAAVKDWYEAGREFAHSLYASAVERMDGWGGEESRDRGGGGEKATKG